MLFRSVERNLLGGVVVKKGAEAVAVKDNVISANGGPGLVLEKGVADGRYGENRVSGNSGKDEVTGLDFSE